MTITDLAAPFKSGGRRKDTKSVCLKALLVLAFP